MEKKENSSSTVAKIGYADWQLSSDDCVYMILTDRFCDGDKDNNGSLGKEYRPGNLHFYQGGDWKGIIQKLDYIKELGFSAIWISAPQDNELFSRSGDEAGYHGYYTHDFYHTNLHFGTEKDLALLLASAKEKNIKVILDAQLNHVADYLEYPSLVYDPEEYRPAPPFDNPLWYHNTPNIIDFKNQEERENCSLGGLDDLAQENPDCWSALMDAYWCPHKNSGWFSYGFAGSRIDAVLEIPSQYLSLYEKHTGKPSFGEALTGSVDENAAIEKNIWGMLDYPLYFQMNETFCVGKTWEGIKNIFDQDYKYRNAHHLFTFLDNHDRARFLANAGDHWGKLRLALAFIYAARGIPIIYYGTEQNMAGDFKYSEANLNYYNREMMVDFCTTSTYIYIKRLNEIRREYSDVLAEGMQVERFFSYNETVYAFSRKGLTSGTEILCIYNNSPFPQSRMIKFDKSTTYYKAGQVLYNLLDTQNKIEVEKNVLSDKLYVMLTIPANAAALYINRKCKKYSLPSFPQTIIKVHYDVGWGNQIYIRGNVSPLNWQWGQKCENISFNIWQCIIERPIDTELEFKVLINDCNWEMGKNHYIKNGNKIDIYPCFNQL